MRPDEKFEISEISRSGEPIAPIRTKNAFVNQCGVLVRDKIPISIHQWLKPAANDAQVTYVTDMQKEDLWTELKSNFVLPREVDPANPVKEELIKSAALSKMADQFRAWKKKLNTFVKDKTTPEFVGIYEKIKDDWPAFVAHKKSEKSQKMSETNRINAAKKMHHHRTGSGGYLVARPKWARAENDLLQKGIEPETMHWPERCRTWFFGAGGTLDPVSGWCIWTDKQLETPLRKMRQYIKAAHAGTFIPDRENDELTMALGNP